MCELLSVIEHNTCRNIQLFVTVSDCGEHYFEVTTNTQ